MKTILHAVHIHATPATVYDALTTSKGLTGVIHFAFTGDFHPQMKQTTLERPRLVRWTCVGGHWNWQDNTFSFTLTERKDETLFNRAYYLNSLKQLCEKGAGAPFAPPA